MENLTVIKNLIKAMADYYAEYDLEERDFINTLIDLGITEEDFIKCGYDKEYLKQYLD